MKQTKICSKCKIEKDISCFGKDNSTRDKLKSWCKSCRTNSSKKLYQKYREYNRNNNSNIVEKTCSKCKTIKSIDNFYPNICSSDGYMNWCIDCKKTWDNINKDKIRKRNKLYYIKNKSILKYKSKEIYKKYFKQNREKILIANKVYRENNKHISKLAKARRRALQNNAIGKFTKEDVLNQLSIQNDKCFYCNCSLNNNYHLDHIIPLSKGGTNFINNIVATCPHCNLSKGSSNPELFVEHCIKKYWS